jgi:hypothetical protein
VKRSGIFSQAGCLAFILAMCVCPLIAQDDPYALLVQKSPEYGGVVTPSDSVQMTGIDQLITITAIPRDGYEFVYWLGDVTTPTNSVTTVLVDTPKMVIAIFQRPENEIFAETNPGGSARGGGSSSRGRRNSIPASSLMSSSSGSGSRSYSPVRTNPEYIIYYPNDDPDDPDDPDVPEPATMLMLGAGAIMLLRKRK